MDGNSNSHSQWLHIYTCNLPPFSQVLKEIRESRRVSQAKMAEMIDTDHSYLSRLETGARTPSREFVKSLIEKLQLDVKDESMLLLSAGFYVENAVVMVEITS